MVGNRRRNAGSRKGTTLSLFGLDTPPKNNSIGLSTFLCPFDMLAVVGFNWLFGVLARFLYDYASLLGYA